MSHAVTRGPAHADARIRKEQAMTLRMVCEQRGDYGFNDAYEIHVTCDWCGERIRELRDGVYCWRIDMESGLCIDGTIHYVHTDCWEGFGPANSGAWDWDWRWLMDLHMNLLGNLRPLGDRERYARLKARGHVDDVLFPDASEPGSAFQMVTKQESERWAQEHPAIQLTEGQVYEEAVLLRRMD
jgi:hypothetical protein